LAVECLKALWSTTENMAEALAAVVDVGEGIGHANCSSKDILPAPVCQLRAGISLHVGRTLRGWRPRVGNEPSQRNSSSVSITVALPPLRAVNSPLRIA